MREILQGKNVYFDTNICIYLIEGFREYEYVLEELGDMLQRKQFQTHSSELTLSEALVGPFKSQKQEHIELYQSFLESSGVFILHPTHRTTYILAAELSARIGLKLPDAIHVATALEAGCDIFLTNDTGIKIPSQIPLEVMYLRDCV